MWAVKVKLALAPRLQAKTSSQGVPSMACVIGVVSAKRTSTRPVRAAMPGSAPSIRSSLRMVSIRPRPLE